MSVLLRTVLPTLAERAPRIVTTVMAAHFAYWPYLRSSTQRIAILVLLLVPLPVTRMSRPRLILADDHPLILEALSHLLQAEFDIVRTAIDGEELVRAARETEADLLITDLSMPGLNGIRAIARIHEQRPGARILVLSMHDAASYAREALAAGAVGYLCKTDASEELLTAIDCALRGESYVSASLRAHMHPDPAMPQPASAARTENVELSARQRAILQLLAEGRAAKQIAVELNISVKTVEYHRKRLLTLLQLESTAELIRYATRLGLV